jgi:outer membrane protein
MNKKILFLGCFLVVSFLNAQTTPPGNETNYSFSLQQAIEYALKNDANVKNAAIDEDIARKKVLETTGLGLPQVNANVDVKDFIKIPTTVAPAGVFAPGVGDGKYMALSFGTKYQGTAGLEASQLLFSGEYLVGLQASKVFVNLSTKALERTKNETAVTVSKAYYGVLINQKRIELINANIDRVQTAMNGAQGLYSYGFAEKLDYDRLVVAYNNLTIEKEKAERAVALTLYLLKFQMGMDVNANLILTDKIEDVKLDISAENAEKFDYEKRPDFQLAQAQVKISKLDLKRNRFAYLPSAALYASHGYNGFSRSDNFDLLKNKVNSDLTATNPNEIKDWTYFWYPATIIGARVSIPVFSGFQRHAKAQQAKLNLEKSENMLEMFKKSIDLELASSATMLQNASVSLENQKKNIALAEDIYKAAKLKFEQGVGSNLEMVDAESTLKEAQTNYLGALYDAIIAKIEFDKANGNIKY